MPATGSNRTNILRIYTEVLKDLAETKALFESKGFSAKEFALSSSEVWLQCSLGFCRCY